MNKSLKVIQKRQGYHARFRSLPQRPQNHRFVSLISTIVIHITPSKSSSGDQDKKKDPLLESCGLHIPPVVVITTLIIHRPRPHPPSKLLREMQIYSLLYVMFMGFHFKFISSHYRWSIRMYFTRMVHIAHTF